jgi:hypothetical protein
VSWLCSPRVKSRVTEPSSLSQIYKKHKTLVPLKDCLLRMSFETLFVDALSRRPKIADIIHIPLKKGHSRLDRYIYIRKEKRNACEEKLTCYEPMTQGRGQRDTLCLCRSHVAPKRQASNPPKIRHNTSATSPRESYGSICCRRVRAPRPVPRPEEIDI